MPKRDMESSKIFYGFKKETKEIIKLSFPVVSFVLCRPTLCTLTKHVGLCTYIMLLDFYDLQKIK